MRCILGSGLEIPGIVRRAERTSHLLPVGFVHPQRFQERRLRVGSYVKVEEAERTVSPDQLLQMHFVARSRCMQAAAEVACLARSAAVSVGILGSAALEIATQLPYTDAASDLDILIGYGAYEAVYETCRQIEEIGTRNQLKIDIEVSLPNGYGIKAQELLMKTQTILGKSLTDVKLLKRSQVQTLLK